MKDSHPPIGRRVFRYEFDRIPSPIYLEKSFVSLLFLMLQNDEFEPVASLNEPVLLDASILVHLNIIFFVSDSCVPRFVLFGFVVLSTTRNFLRKLRFGHLPIQTYASPHVLGSNGHVSRASSRLYNWLNTLLTIQWLQGLNGSLVHRAIVNPVLPSILLQDPHVSSVHLRACQLFSGCPLIPSFEEWS